jgi:RNA-binding protein 26
VSELAAKQKLLEQQITEQKSLMTSLETSSPEEKKGILARLRKLGEEMTIPSIPSPPSATPAKVHSPAPVLTAQNDHEKKERDRLDKELELHAVGESTEELKAKLAKLREEAASLGIPETTPEVSYGAPYRGYRGRGRGARGAFYRGAPRGGPPRASMKLDNRPRKLLVKGVREDNLQALRDWYEVR